VQQKELDQSAITVFAENEHRLVSFPDNPEELAHKR